jgi:hypothetical protein
VGQLDASAGDSLGDIPESHGAHDRTPGKALTERPAAGAVSEQRLGAEDLAPQNLMNLADVGVVVRLPSKFFPYGVGHHVGQKHLSQRPRRRRGATPPQVIDQAALERFLGQVEERVRLGAQVEAMSNDTKMTP